MQNPYFPVVRTSTLRASGVSKATVQGPQWQRRARGLLVPANTGLDALTGRLGDAAALATEGCAIGGWASFAVQGNPWLSGPDPEQVRDVLVHCPPGRQLRARTGIRPFRGLTYPDEMLDLDGLTVTTMARAAFDEMRLARSLREAVIALDMAISTAHGAPHTTLARVAAVVGAHHKVKGLLRAQEALPLASRRSASPLETSTRLVLTRDVGVERVAVNVPVFSPAGDLLGIVDLLDLDSGLMVETDGEHHRDLIHHTKDNWREEKLERAGAVVSRVTAWDHRDRLALSARLNEARRAAGRIHDHRWTLAQPDWWRKWEPARRWD
ncbi:hypothetical protein BHE97_08875 [Aeromicrobium sp. PE09-221]|uniref:hypothetical protein n=1 Tax=Aeromicrobium sp. PE09-221 TaxID=1898043 RepID=UPI000B3E815E|nr:hypothetical protein [Aeromicrobium sp. PE09-221]OUZ09917.1 hypothetical protein BHE97_08875 [Aeromicrobium sp. PE09-221]